jgi:hypothetical protein
MREGPLVRHYTIESLREGDICDGESVGSILVGALEQEGIESRYHRVHDPAGLRDCLSSIAVATRAANEAREGQPEFILPFLHIAAHGNENGIGLTSGDGVFWPVLRKMLIDFTEEAGIRINPYGIPLHTVLFSSCCGAFARRMFAFGEPFPCFGIVGPVRDVTWSEAVTGYVSFYHSLLPEGRFPDAVAAMNRATGLDGVFQHYPAGTQN